MKPDILKRILVLEQRVNVNSVPDLIVISYEPEKKKWVIQESYCAKEGEFKTEVLETDRLEEYCVPIDFKGACIVNVLMFPEGAVCPTKAFSEKALPKNYDLICLSYE